MSYLIESWNLSMEDKKKFRINSVEAGIARALHLGIVTDREELVVWGLSSSAVGLGGWTFGPPIGRGWDTWIQHENTSRGVLVIIKVTILSPLTPGLDGIRFFAGSTKAALKASYSLSQLYGIAPLLQAIQEKLSIDRLAGVRENLESWPIMEGYFSEPIIYDPRDNINIDLLCDSTDGIGLALGGFVIRRIGEDIIF